ncbi:fimbrial protein [Paraburkholderia solisilvae]|uniref:Fimbrial-type adhesion domain-containing protein n=1 Tax=Paraburkholderia solisilvae TaxID=624376 RepID=A0A6J5E510_9BURK|nr:fimbrial protein [Paraburkholderia solisilvae]CAB3761047.1 hypothetical protein LMG29739_03527 [Paraburkholderia solisilvae]
MKNFFSCLFKVFLIVTLAGGPCVCVARYNNCTAPLPLTVNIPSVSIPAKLAVGQAVPGARAVFSIPITCTENPNGDWFVSVTASSYTLVPGFSDVYTTAGMGGGIGFRLRNAAGTALTAISNTKSNDTFDFGRGQTGTNILAGSFELVKTAEGASGSFSFSALVHVQDQQYANGSDAPSRLNFAYTLTPTKVPSCSVSNTNVDVTLPAVTASAFKGVGTTAGATSFSIGLECEDNAKPAITLTDSNMPANQSTALTTVPTSTAKGVGVQILYNAQPLPLGPAPYSYTDSNTPVTNRISLGPRSGTTALALQGRYVQTDATLVPGTIRAVATFILSYN